ncbi:segregation/condensation protein A [Oscillatoria sp. CS-180]|uniref:segregation/condensation protein A n=1 Tax=Oscillatoria sp. CS-180 TaxID=3021720 RepID=UPI00232DBA6E|nr:segregation/condensation protein A [Oscillatoria sp. CS-180]MDB9524938.1 segregation/condensation protein A [Oscillatoria sp. CS-180]
MTVSLAQSAIAFLIDLAEQGEIDPWDVKVIDVIDRFLKTLKTEPDALPSSGRSPYEASLSESGKAFLYASMLVLLKADTLVRAEMDEEQAALEAEALFEDADELAEMPLPRNLEQHLHRRAIAPPPERRQVTLNELIEQLETIAAVISDQPPRSRVRRARPIPKRNAVRAITQLAHQENLSEIADALESFLDQYWDTLQEKLSWLNFEELLSEWPKYRPEQDNHIADSPEAAEKHERVGVFWGLLYLSAQSKVELSQQELYSELWVRNLKQIADEDLDIPPHVLPD